MRGHAKRRLVSVCFALLLLVAPTTGCSNALFLQDYQRDLLGLFLGSAFSVLVGATFSSVRVERNCFENGVLVDCSQLPNMGMLP